MAEPGLCGLPPHPAYSEEPGSAFHAEAVEVVEVSRRLTPEQRLIARFWSDDPMLSPTPPGHWISIAMQILERQQAPAARRAEVLALLGITLADAFIACWRDKYAFDLLRPVTYIRRVIDKGWEPLLITPPFPEYPSGHSVQSGAAATVLTALFGEGFAFTDRTHVDDGLPARDYADFWTAAREAGLSRLYGGIHYRSAVERGLEQGICVGAQTLRVRLWA
jgi:membrane-associated phospholipid phosphatase